MQIAKYSETFAKLFAHLQKYHQKQSPGGVTFLKKRISHRCISVTFAKPLRTPFFIDRIPPVAALASCCKIRSKSYLCCRLRNLRSF